MTYCYYFKFSGEGIPGGQGGRWANATGDGSKTDEGRPSLTKNTVFLNVRFRNKII